MVIFVTTIGMAGSTSYYIKLDNVAFVVDNFSSEIFSFRYRDEMSTEQRPKLNKGDLPGA